MIGLEARALERELDARQVQGGGVGKHVALGERPRLGVAVAQAGDAVVEQPPARLQQPCEHARVLVDAVRADVLDHADRGDRVEALAADARPQVAVVAYADLDPVLQARLGHAPARELGLGGGQRDAEGMHPVLAAA